jgi:hypothetical protein
MAGSTLRYVLPLACLMFMASPAAATWGDHTVAKFMAMPEPVQLVYLSGALNVMGGIGGVRCAHVSTGGVRELLINHVKLGRLGPDGDLVVAIFLTLDHIGCTVEDMTSKKVPL